jgi:hypothetical protein
MKLTYRTPTTLDIELGQDYAFLDGIRHWTGADRRQRSSSNRLGGKYRFDDWQISSITGSAIIVSSANFTTAGPQFDITVIRGEVPVKFFDISFGMCTVPGTALPQAKPIPNYFRCAGES